MKRLIIIYLSILLPIASGASSKDKEGFRRVTFGAEWSYIASFHSGVHHNFFSDEGYRVDLNQNGFSFRSNGEVYLHVGYNLNRNWNISFYTGYAGVYDHNNAIPVSIRTTRMFRQDREGDRWMVFLDAGSGLCLKKPVQEIVCGKIGTGYRISLSPDSSLDFLLAYRMTLTHPDIIYDDYKVDYSKINRNNAYTSALSIGISLSF